MNKCLCLLLAGVLFSCAPARPSDLPLGGSLEQLREGKADLTEPERAAAWLLAELLAPGGSAAGALEARARLEKLGAGGWRAQMARALDDQVHGRLTDAPEHYLKAAQELQGASTPHAALLAHFALSRGLDGRDSSSELWSGWKDWVETSLGAPQGLGWRGRDALVNWWADEAWAAAEANVEKEAIARLGCLTGLQLAGPFGNGSRAAYLQSYEAESLGAWPERFPVDPSWGRSPRVLKTKGTGCTVESDEAVREGTFYAATYLNIAEAKKLILLVKGALKLWVDGELVLDRDLREWGSWTKVGAGLELSAGQHRVVARLMTPQTALRMLTPEGLPLKATASAALEGVGMSGRILSTFEANALRAYVSKVGVKAPPEPLLLFAAAHLAEADGESEVATLLLEPLVKDAGRATGPALALAAQLVEGDPIFDANQTKDLIRELNQAALAKDKNLWEPALAAASHLEQDEGISAAVTALEALTVRFPQVSSLLGALSSIYGRLGWKPEQQRVSELRAQRFPNDVEGLLGAATELEAQGKWKEAERLRARVRKLDPDGESMVALALERQDYSAALKELARLAKRRPQQKELPGRLQSVRLRAGVESAGRELLKKAVKDKPLDGVARLKLADALYASGEGGALQDAIIDAVQAGADLMPLKSALDLTEGLTELAPYRLDAKAIIAEYEATGEHMAGQAARILDYLAVWVRADGSSRSLEHEIIRIQSEEAISRLAEHPVRGKVVLQMRVIKRDGTILEPELVSGKPTVTLPHLEVGDYIETEQLIEKDGALGGAAYQGVHWFFREKGIAYARSELVVVSPAHRNLQVESWGPSPKPQLEERGYFRVHRWRADHTPPAPNEPMSVPVTEYLPSVRIGWGLTLERRLEVLANRTTPSTPVDPRVVRLAQKIVEGIPEAEEQLRARKLYRWIVSNVREGKEPDGRRVVIGKEGNRWQGLATLCRALGIDVRWGIARTRLAPEPRSEREAAEQYRITVMRVGDVEPRWITIGNKFTPFGYLPAAIRGMPAHLLTPEGPALVHLPTEGTLDRVVYAGTGQLKSDGSAELRLLHSYEGQHAAGLREGFSQIAERQMPDIIENKLLAPKLPGARLLSHELVDLPSADVPLVLRLSAEVARMGEVEGNRLRVRPPFGVALRQLAALPERKTAMLLNYERREDVQLQLELPPGAVAVVSKPQLVRFGEFRVEVSDESRPGLLLIKRRVVIPSGRVKTADYAKFQAFTQAAEAVTNAPIIVKLGPSR